MGKISTSTWYDAPSIVTTMHRCEQTIFTINLKNLRSSAWRCSCSTLGSDTTFELGQRKTLRGSPRGMAYDNRRYVSTLGH
jgi:hypothetical protein